jgi:hypothetical protein
MYSVIICKRIGVRTFGMGAVWIQDLGSYFVRRHNTVLAVCEQSLARMAAFSLQLSAFDEGAGKNGWILRPSH